MNINRNNYEDFFLLYADQELSSAEMQEVDRFVQENPDLAIELNDFLATRLTLDEIDFDKTYLYKSSEEGIRQENATEWFSKFVDEELSPKQREAVEEYVLQHPEQQAIFLEWQQTKLPQEAIACPRKADLYKTATPSVVVMMKRYWSVAALLLILLGVYLVTQLNGNNPDPSPVAQQTKPIDRKVIPAENESSTTRPNEFIAASTVQSAVSKNVKAINQSPENKTAESETELGREIRNEEIIADNMNEASNYSETAANTISQGVNNIEAKNIDAVTAKANEISTPNYTYKTLDLDDDDKSMYVGPIEINKDKFRGFVRKAGGLFRSKMKNEGEEVLNSITSIAQPILK